MSPMGECFSPAGVNLGAAKIHCKDNGQISKLPGLVIELHAAMQSLGTSVSQLSLETSALPETYAQLFQVCNNSIM